MNKIVFKDLYTFLTADSTLVNLTDHTATDIRIARRYPFKVAEVPFLAFWLEGDIPLVERFITQVRRSVIGIQAIDSDELNCMDIADRVRTLFEPVTGKDPVIASNDISYCSAYVSSQSTPLYNEDTDWWHTSLRITLMWYVGT